MLEPEARRLRALLDSYPVEALSPMLNVGSSTGHFRTQSQPWIEAQVFAPLRARGVEIIHADVREGDGIDLRANLLTDEGQDAMRAVGARSAMLCNVLEHVPDPDMFLNRLLEALPGAATLFVTVPNSYPYHEDPIDTMFRPGPEEVAAMARNTTLLHGEVMDAGSYRETFRTPFQYLRLGLRLLLPFRKRKRWKQHVHQAKWLFRPYQITFAVLRKAA